MLLGKAIVMCAALLLVVCMARPEYERIHFGAAAITEQAHLTVNGVPLSLWGVNVPQVQDSCGPPDKRWACGAYAAAAMVMHLSKAHVMCREQGVARAIRSARCYTSTNLITWHDLARTLVREGWAVPDLAISQAYLTATTPAEQSKAGMWR